MPSPHLALIALLAALLAPKSAGAEPNILVIVLDDVGVDVVGAYGAADPIDATPNLDALAADGLLFRHAWVSPSCSPMRATLMTGRYGFRTGIGQAGHAFPPDTDELFLPAALPPVYAKAAFGKWHLNSYGPSPFDPMATLGANPVTAGFDLFRGTPQNFRNERNQPEGEDYFSWGKAYEPEGVWEADRTDFAESDLVDDAVAFIASDPEPWFAYVAFHAAHTPIQAPPDELHTRQAVKDAFEPGDIHNGSRELHHALLEAADTEIGRLLQSVDPTDTYVLLIGDNGTVESFVPPGAVQRGGKGDVWEGGVHVPLVVVGPDVAVGETDALVHGVDVFATVVELAGGDPSSLPTSGPFDGVSFAPVLTTPTTAPRSTLFVEGKFPGSETARLPENHDVAVRNDGYKLVRRACVDGFRSFELYHLAADPGESTDLLPLPEGSPHRTDHLELHAALADLVGNPPCAGAPPACGLGPEAVVLLTALLGLRRRRPAGRRARPAG